MSLSGGLTFRLSLLLLDQVGEIVAKDGRVVAPDSDWPDSRGATTLLLGAPAGMKPARTQGGPASLPAVCGPGGAGVCGQSNGAER